MLKDIGFWDAKGNYIEDIQEIGAEEMLSVEQINRLESENERLKALVQKIKAIAGEIMIANLCANCDGIGLDANCQDTDCPVYQMAEILQLIEKAEVRNND